MSRRKVCGTCRFFAQCKLVDRGLSCSCKACGRWREDNRVKIEIKIGKDN